MITVAGLSPSLDLTYLVDSFVLGRIHRPTEVVSVAGGKPLNLARAARRLGAEVTAVAVLGGDTGRRILGALRADGVEVVVVETPAETRTCVSVAAADSDELTELYENAAPIPAPVWADVVAALTVTLARSPGWLAISGGAPSGLPPEAIAEVVGVGVAAGARVAVDTHGAALAAAVAQRPAVVKVNRFEAAELLEVAADGALEDLAAGLRARTRGSVVLTDGQHGSLAVHDGGTIRLPAASRFGRYPVGSGDSFLGGLLSALDAGADWDTAMRTAAAAGTANALVPGPAVFDLATVDQLKSQCI